MVLYSSSVYNPLLHSTIHQQLHHNTSATIVLTNTESNTTVSAYITLWFTLTHHNWQHNHYDNLHDHSDSYYISAPWAMSCSTTEPQNPNQTLNHPHLHRSGGCRECTDGMVSVGNSNGPLCSWWQHRPWDISNRVVSSSLSRSDTQGTHARTDAHTQQHWFKHAWCSYRCMPYCVRAHSLIHVQPCVCVCVCVCVLARARAHRPRVRAAHTSGLLSVYIHLTSQRCLYIFTVNKVLVSACLVVQFQIIVCITFT